MITPVRAQGVFAMASREGLWLLGPEPELREERLSHGVAEFRGDRVDVLDRADEELLELSEGAMRDARTSIAGLSRGSARLIATARRPPEREPVIAAHIVVSIGAISFVTSPEDVARDHELLLSLADRDERTSIEDRDLPLVWRNGTGAVLMHEAAGHPAEWGSEPIEWPSWLRVRDEPELEFDDLGRPVSASDLLRGERPRTARCASFADVPLQRMSNVVVTHSDDAPVGLPRRRLDILAVSGGDYDPLSDRVLIAVAAATFVDGKASRAAAPFVIDEPRSSVALALRGATGDPERYPGVVCSLEGQELVVGSFAPLLITEF